MDISITIVIFTVMNNDNKTIHDFDFSLICSYFKAMPRQGPGSPEATRMAAGFIGPLDDNAKTADLGCGTGGQTMTLAECVKGDITGIDLFPDFIEIFNGNALRAGLSERVKGVTGSMDDLPFGEGELDLIWSEGAIYNIGYEEGLRLWHKYLKPNGYVAVTEATWFRPDPPKEIETFWMENYPFIDTIGAKVRQMEDAGYSAVAHFILPEECWTDNYFAHQEPAMESFLKQHPGNETVKELIKGQRRERSLYHKYKEYYGYVFYIGRKI